MTTDAFIRRPRDGDIEAMLPHIREADRQEVWAAGKLTPEIALRRGLAASDRAFTGVIDGEIVAMFGVTPGSILGGVGVPWMLGTEAIERHAVAFIRQSRPALWMMHARYDYLINFVDDRNKAAIRWLQWLGFHVEQPVPMGPFRVPFRRFSRSIYDEVQDV